ncbi:hypothetical protein [Undibacterium sp. WLHG33]|uniref:hypothetical protein n=1 Tax=Undibacterium sp. WLHG33 TaxID=3412482 RepID=UPI003C2ABB9C
MVISTDAIAAVTPLGLSALSPVSTVSAAVIAGSVNTTASVVDVSSLSQTLAMTLALLEQEMKAIAASGSGSAIGDAATSFTTTASLATMFVNAFNTFQSSNISSLQDPLTSFLDSSLLDAMGGVLADSGNNLLQSLAKIGITLDTSTGTDNIQFTLNSSLLQTAFTNAPVATASLLTQALQALAQIETSLIAQNQNLRTAEVSGGVGNSARNVSFSDIFATATTALSSGITSVTPSILKTQKTVAVGATDTAPGIVSAAEQSNAPPMATAQQVSASSETVNTSLTSSTVYDAAALKSANTTVTQQKSVPDKTAVEPRTGASITAFDQSATSAAQAQTLVSADFQSDLLKSGADVIQTGHKVIVGSEVAGTTANSLSSVSMATLLNSVKSSQELTDVVAPQTPAAPSGAALVHPLTMQAFVVTAASAYRLNDPAIVNTLSPDMALSDATVPVTAVATTTADAVTAANVANDVAVSGVNWTAGVNPVISAAVAAYKVSDAIEHLKPDQGREDRDEVVFGNEIPPVAMDLKQDAGQQSTSETRQSKKSGQAKNADMVTDATASAPPHGSIDINT